MQSDAIKPGQTVVVVDDLIATGMSLRNFRVNLLICPDDSGGSAKAAGELVSKLGGEIIEYLFIIELTFLKAAEKLNAPLYSIVQSDD